MAQSADALAKDIREEFLTCSMCLNCFSRPKMLPCQHVFCTRCLHKWYESRAGQSGTSSKSVTCPMCRISHPVPANGILGFLDSHATTSLMNFLGSRVETTASWGPNTVGLIREFGEKGSHDGQLYKPLGIAVSAETGEIFVTDCKNRIQVFDNDGTFLRKFTFPQLPKKFTPTHLSMTRRLSSDEKECLLVSDVNNKRVLVCSLNGEILMHFGGNELGMPGGVGVTKDGSIHVVDVYARVVRSYSRTGQLLRSFGGQVSNNNAHSPNNDEKDECTFRSPTHIVVTRSDILLVSDSQSHYVYIFDTDGGYRNKFNTIGRNGGQLQSPTGMAIDASGNILVADSNLNSVQLFDYRGRFRTRVDDSFDGLRNPQGMTVMNDEHVAVVDEDNHCIKIFSYLWERKDLWKGITLLPLKPMQIVISSLDILIFLCRLIIMSYLYFSAASVRQSPVLFFYTPGAYCIKRLPEKNSGYFNRSFFPMVNIMLTWVFRFYLSFPLVKVLCNGPRACIIFYIYLPSIQHFIGPYMFQFCNVHSN